MQLQKKSLFCQWLFLKKLHVLHPNPLRLLLLAILAVFFLTLSILILITNSQLHVTTIPYSNQTQLIFTTSEDIKGPVFILYQLNNFFQNNRIYAQSKSSVQLSGKEINQNRANRDCGQNASLNKYFIQAGYTHSWGGHPLNPQAIASPCGLIAKSFFNDSYQVINQNGQPLQISNQGISWPGQKGFKFARGNNSQISQWIDPQDQRFINWMLTAGLPKFDKLWGIINDGIPLGNYTINIKNNYNASAYDSSKSLIITNVSQFGGKNDYLGWFCLSSGIMNIFAIILQIYKLNLKNKDK